MHKTINALFMATLALIVGCSDGSDSRPDQRDLTVLVTNDDGIGAPGIDVLVNTLRDINGIDLQVVAPAENQSGSSDNTTDGEVSFAPAVTASGFPATAVDGFPADSVRVAIEELGIVPDLVVSGVNSGQNVGPLAPLSGTVGAARYAARAGYPALAGSAGLGSDSDFGAAADLIVDWIEDNRRAIADGTVSTEFVVSFNVPNCTSGQIRELFMVPRATEIPEGGNVFFTDCTVEPDGPPVSDVDAMIKGHAAQTDVELEF